jgi:hypothetical protein
VASYASAVTMALAWLFWTGRVLPRPAFVTESSGDTSLSDPIKRANRHEGGSPPPPLPDRNLTVVGTTLRLGELEVTPLDISRRKIKLVRLDGFTGKRRVVENVLVLTLRVKNRSQDRALTPLEPSFIRTAGTADDESFIETAASQRISMYNLAPESEWSIRDQAFPTLKPDEAAETIVVSEPVKNNELASPMIWHLKLRATTYQTDVLGVRFSSDDVTEGGY